MNSDGKWISLRTRYLSACLLLACVSLWRCGSAPGVQQTGEDITSGDMRARIGFLASDALAGRGTPSRGLEIAAAYIESEFRRFGLESPGGRGYVQRYRIATVGGDAGGPSRGDGQAPNVIGILPGSDPRLRDEYMVLSAHMDGLGVGRSVDGDSIYNGADDNASGTAALLEVAEALSRSGRPPARSVIFLAVSGEERGLWGSGWFVSEPPVSLDRIVAAINVDMIGRNWEDRISVIGKGYSTLGSVVDSVAAAHPELSLDVVGDLWPQERFFFRSDHYNFARMGVPAIFFFNGVHEDYHQPSDEADRIKYEKAARVARLILATVTAVADAETRPRWDRRARAAIVEPGR